MITSCFLGQFNGILLGNRGYPCLPHLLTPYTDPTAQAQRRDNFAHCKTRVRIEMTFGLLKSRFQCLKGLRVAPDRACDICVAWAVLQNIAIIRRKRMPAIAPEDNWEQIDAAAFENADGRAVRDLYSNT